jgi:4-oxalmesaconate hydratase
MHGAKQGEFANESANAPSVGGARVRGDEIREAIGNGRLKLQRERGSELPWFSPITLLRSPLGQRTHGP